MKLLHCADIHLDSPLRGLTQYGDAPVDAIRGATRRAFENAVQLAIDEQVTAVVIAGDLYDGDRDDFNTATFLQRQYDRLREHGIVVAVVYGNHDAANDITKRLRPPDNVHIFSHSAPETIELEHAGLALHGQSYAQRVIKHDLSLDYPGRVAGVLNVGVLHTCLAGDSTHLPYAPCSESGLAAKGYEYWALGHVHHRYETRVDGSTIVFPGNLQGRHMRETGPKGASLVTYEGDTVVRVEHRDLDVVRWSRCEVDVTGLDDVDEVLARVTDELDKSVEAADGRLVAARVVLNGTSAVAAELRAGREAWESQLRADAAGSTDRVWIEQVRLDARPPAPTADVSDAVSAITDAIAAIARDPAAQQRMASELSPLRSRLGGDMKELTEIGLTPLEPDAVAALLPEIEAMLLAQLHGEVI